MSLHNRELHLFWPWSFSVNQIFLQKEVLLQFRIFYDLIGEKVHRPD